MVETWAQAQDRYMTKTLDLNGTWELAYFEETGSLPLTPEALEGYPCERVTAQVPGNVELDLARAGKIASDPFHGLNILELRRLEGFQWWYRRSFATPDWVEGSETELVCEGLDCFATIWVNGIEIGRSANALIPHRFNISTALAPRGGTNQIAIRLTSPVNAVKERPIDAECQAPSGHYESLWARKPAHAYGWDIMPRALSAGLWRPVRLEERRCTELTDVFLDTRSVTADQAILDCRIAFRTDAPLRDFGVRVTGKCGESAFEKEWPLFFTRAGFEVTVPHPLLWWPRGYGAAPLYDVTVTLLHQGEPVSDRQFHLGIRTLQLDRTDLHTPEQPGRFAFLVNGVPIFCRGSNWVPADAFHSRDAERIPRILDLIAEMDCNMVRCWGGNVYESDAFFDFCDREGILVWQDFGMACAAYPQRPDFLEMIRTEAESVITQFRQHPSIALWSGDNEVDELHLGWGFRRTDPNRNRITREILPEAVRLLDPRRPYLASSPYFGPAAVSFPEPGRVVPEQHLWGPRDYYKSDFYRHNNALFASEIGYHGCPNIASIRRFISPEKLWPCRDNDEWFLHSTDSIPEYPQAQRVQLMLTQIRELFGDIPDGLEPFAVASQIVQAEAKKFFLELFRQRKGTTTGILWWNMMDGWPQFSDAIVDYYYSKKLAFHYLKRVHGPFAVIVGEESDGIHPVVAVNDSQVARSGNLTIRDADTDRCLLETTFTVEPNGRTICGQIPHAQDQQHLYLIEWSDNGKTGHSHYLSGKPPFRLEQYRFDWLPKIARLDPTFLAEEVGR